MPHKVKKVPAPQRGLESGVSGSVSSSSNQPTTERTSSTAPAPKPSPKVAISTKQQDAKCRREAEAEATKRQMERNVRWFSKWGLPSVYNIPKQEMQCPHPDWLRRANRMWRMEARIIDFWSGGAQRDAEMFRYLEFLGFRVVLDQSATQIGVACGMVAAQNAVKLQFSSSHTPLCAFHILPQPQMQGCGNNATFKASSWK